MSHGRFDNPVSATLAGFRDRFRRQPLADRFTNADRLDGKRVLITGANSGLGFATAVAAAARGASVVMAGRSDIPGAGERVRALSGASAVQMQRLDLSDFDSIHAGVDALAETSAPFDVVLLNAATTLPEARQTAAGQDQMFMVNYLANVVLVFLLLDRGLIALGAMPAPRVIVISSDSHRGASAIDYSEFGTFFDYGVRKAIANYSYFKLVLNTFATALHRRVNRDAQAPRVCVNLICPGPVNSNIIKEAPLALRAVLRALFTVIFKSPERAADPVVYLAASDDFSKRSNVYLHMFTEKRMDPKVYDPSAGDALWDASLALWRDLDPRAAKVIDRVTRRLSEPSRG